MIKKVISGGQCGADMGGLKAAKAFMILTGGIAPLNYRDENGFNPSLKIVYGLKESTKSNYRHRTIENVKNSDGTIIFMYKKSIGSILTQDICIEYGKPCFIYYSEPKLTDESFKNFANWVNEFKIEILNVAGNRESVSPGIERSVMIFLAFCFNYMKINNE